MTLSNFGCTRPSPVWIASLHRSGVICTNVFGIELRKQLSRTTLIQYRSPEEYSGLDRSPGLPRFLLIWYSLIPEFSEIPLTMSNFGCTRPSPVWIALLRRSGVICTNKCGIELRKKLTRTTLIRYQSQEEYSGLDLLPSLPCFLLMWYFLIPEVGETP